MTQKEILKEVAQCNVAYHVLGQTDRSAMPIGDGELVAGIWVTEDGCIHCYLSRSDALTELDRTVKLGEIILSFSPVQFTPEAYTQTLVLTDGCIRLAGRDGEIHLWIDPATHSLCVRGRFQASVEARVRYHTWRTAAYAPIGEFQSCGAVAESADVVQERGNETLFCHQNGKTMIRDAARLQNLHDSMALIPDLLSGRIFGGLLAMEQEATGFALRVATHSMQGALASFEASLREKLAQTADLQKSMERARTFWHAYWSKSYLFVENDPPLEPAEALPMETGKLETREYTCLCASTVTRAYTFTKYMFACCSTGAMPVLYNGLLFNLCPGMDEHFTSQNFGRVCTAQPVASAQNVTPDERSWCTEQLWQNLRHPYYSTLARGETVPLRVLFSYYRRFWEVNRLRAKRYFQAQGQHNTEMTLSCGLQSPEIYGTDRADRPDGYAHNRWGGAVDISPGLELVGLMLDYYDYTQDADFLQTQVLPYFSDLLRYIETRFPRMERGVMQIGPINSVETYRDTINPTPIVAGLHSTLRRVLSLPPSLVADYLYLKTYEAKLPPIAANQQTLLPAQVYEEERFNVEVPELYAIYPFKLHTFYRGDPQIAKRTYELRTYEYGIRECFRIGQTPKAPSCSGWQYTGIVAAMLGMTQEAQRILTANCTLQNPGTRFPGMWGPIYDAVPDTDHGANILNQLQTMLMQTDGQKIHLLPAFPPEWNVRFRLYPDAQTSVSVCWQNGRLLELTVTPEERTADVILFSGLWG